MILTPLNRAALNDIVDDACAVIFAHIILAAIPITAISITRQQAILPPSCPASPFSLLAPLCLQTPGHFPPNR